MKMDSDFWNVISIREPGMARPPALRCAKSVHESLFEDREVVDADFPCNPPRSEHLGAILRFVDAHPGQPILVHCVAGLSRSPAVALVVIIRGLLTLHPLTNQSVLVEKAVNLLIQIRAKSRPNCLVLQVGLEQFMLLDQAMRLAIALMNHPVLFRNRSAGNARR